MNCYNFNKVQIPFYKKDIILLIVQIVTLYHASTLGWKVKKIGNRKYELSKSISEIENFDLTKFMNNIVRVKIN